MREIDERDIQAIRLMLMMYRQGWIDASAHLAAEAMRAEYRRLS